MKIETIFNKVVVCHGFFMKLYSFESCSHFLFCWGQSDCTLLVGGTGPKLRHSAETKSGKEKGCTLTAVLA